MKHSVSNADQVSEASLPEMTSGEAWFLKQTLEQAPKDCQILSLLVFEKVVGKAGRGKKF